MTVLQRAVGVVLASIFLIAVLVFASLALGVLLAAGLVAWGWLWWKARALRRGPVVIDAEYRDETPGERLEDESRRRV